MTAAYGDTDTGDGIAQADQAAYITGQDGFPVVHVTVTDAIVIGIGDSPAPIGRPDVAARHHQSATPG